MVRNFYRRIKEAQALLGLLKLKKGGEDFENTQMKTEISQFQKTMLESVFKISMYPNTRTKIDLSLLINLNIKSIGIWLQNRRSSMKYDARKAGKTIVVDNFKTEIDPVILCDLYQKARDSMYKNNEF